MRAASTFALCLVLGLSGTARLGAEPREQSLRDGRVRVRVSTEPEGRVVIGQQTRLFVDILTDTWFTQAPAYPDVDLDGAIALQPEQLGTNFTERIAGATYAAQRRSYVIFPQRAGPLELTRSGSSSRWPRTVGPESPSSSPRPPCASTW